MKKKVLILSGSPRKGGNSDILCDEFMRGAKESGNEVKKIRLAEKNVGYCKACYYCKNSGGKCVIKNDMSGRIGMATLLYGASARRLRIFTAKSAPRVSKRLLA